MFNKDSIFTYTVDNDFDHIFDEKGNTFLALRKIWWGEKTEDSEPKLDLRKWYTTPNGEKVGKGFSFITEDGPHELARVLLENGYGNTEQVIEAIKDREDFMTSLVKIIGNGTLEESGISTEDIETEYYNPKEVLL